MAISTLPSHLVPKKSGPEDTPAGRGQQIENELRDALVRHPPVTRQNIDLADELVLFAQQVKENSEKLLSRAHNTAKLIRQVERDRDAMDDAVRVLNKLLTDRAT